MLGLNRPVGEGGGAATPSWKCVLDFPLEVKNRCGIGYPTIEWYLLGDLRETKIRGSCLQQQTQG